MYRFFTKDSITKQCPSATLIRCDVEPLRDPLSERCIDVREDAQLLLLDAFVGSLAKMEDNVSNEVVLVLRREVAPL